MKKSTGNYEEKNKYRLWYDEPATDWNRALPIGNGRLGAMVFGGIAKERLQLNEDSIWYGEPVDRNNPDALKNLPEIRRLIFAGRIGEAERLAALALSGTPESQRPYQTMGDLNLVFSHDNEAYTDYVRELNLDTAVITVRYTKNSTVFTRRYFASAADQVLAIRLEADKPGSISFSANLRRGRFLDRAGSLSSDMIFMDARCAGGNAIRFRTLVKAQATGGSVRTIGENLIVENADNVTLLVSTATSFRNDDYERACLDQSTVASTKTFGELLKVHTIEYQALYRRVKFELPTETNCKELTSLPTDERLARLRAGEDDPDLACLYFQYGRYLLISSSRPGTLPANLQGIWNGEFTPPWDSKYTININTQMNYWPAETCSLAECHIPLFDLIERMREPGRRTAKAMYGCGGFVAHHNTDIWADTAPQDIYIPATYWPMGAAWLCLHLWEHYEFSMDVSFLKKAYPTMREAAEFFVDFLVEDNKGRLVTCPSVSPENTYILENGEKGCLCAGPSMDSQIIRMLFNRCCKAAQILGIDGEFSEKLTELASNIPSPQIGRHGQIMEWSEDYEEAEPGHRHISHLFALYPGNLITSASPELLMAARKTLERRLAYGGGHTGWSRAWIINLWARLGDGEKSWEHLLELFTKSTLDNLLDNHPPFQIDGNFGGTAGIAEMLMQSHAGEIHLLPALPKSWPNGYVSGLRARGGYIVGIVWAGGELVQAAITAAHSSTVKMRVGQKTCFLEINSGSTIILDNQLESILS